MNTEDEVMDTGCIFRGEVDRYKVLPLTAMEELYGIGDCFRYTPSKSRKIPETVQERALIFYQDALIKSCMYGADGISVDDVVIYDPESELKKVQAILKRGKWVGC